MVKGDRKIMNEIIHKTEIKRRVKEKLKDERYVIGGNGKGHKFSKRYRLRYTAKMVDKIIEAFMNVIADIIEDGDTAILTGLVSFEPQIRKERLQINPYTKEVGLYPEHYIVKAKPGLLLKEACNRLSEKQRLTAATTNEE